MERLDRNGRRPRPPARRLWARLLASPWRAARAGDASRWPRSPPTRCSYGIRASLHTYRYGRDLGSAGLENYRVIFHDHVFWTALATTARYVGFAVAIETVLGLGLALLVVARAALQPLAARHA